MIEIVKEIKNTKSPSGSTPTGNSPKTGDSTNIWLPILLAVLSACGIGGVIWYKKKKEINTVLGCSIYGQPFFQEE